ncbi:hypothetical protein BT93_L4814 [Corymbia citriodora subsp. variegata]|uniref:Uncharacterized protein n=1 Tax=Corymbia citriodora subsp. variegata TaxID=360336 RepID=A0A8T0CTJ2_CORYI|nr:hypothetical protein BT93_L4814 [Corymbia citriodora subsp. variegata]
MKSLPIVHFDNYSYFASWSQICIDLQSLVGKVEGQSISYNS